MLRLDDNATVWRELYTFPSKAGWRYEVLGTGIAMSVDERAVVVLVGAEQVGLGRIIALHYRSSTLYHIR